MALIENVAANQAGLRLLPDLRGRADALEEALSGAREHHFALLLLGDAVGPSQDALDCIRRILALLSSQQAELLPGDREELFLRWRQGRLADGPRGPMGGLVHQLKETAEGDALAEAYAEAVAGRRLWARLNGYLFVHAGFAPQMLFVEAPALAARNRQRRLARIALHGPAQFPLVPKGLAVVTAHQATPWLDLPAEKLARPWNPVLPPPPTPLLTVLIGPAGGGKSTWAKRHADPEAVVSTDAIRQELFGDPRDQSVPLRVFDEAHRRAEALLAAGLPVVFDATNLQAQTRRSVVALVPPDHPVRYIVVDRPLPEKVRDAGWRNEVRVGDRSLVEHHHDVMQSALPNILAGDRLPNVIVEDRRRL